MLLGAAASHFHPVVGVNVRFVHDLRLDELFDDVLQRNQTDRLVERITISGRVHAMHECHVTAMSLLEALEHHVQRHVLEHEVARVLIEFAESTQRCVVIGVDERQILDEQQGQHVLTVTLVDGNTREAGLHDFRDRLEIEHRIVGEHEGVLDVGHDVRHGFLAQLEGTGNDVHLFFVEIVDVLGDLVGGECIE